ncbi:MAG: phosphohistidine phosphatase SixA [Bacillariaceae sp.]|jgi:broad specificity phosphatase PhoE
MSRRDQPKPPNVATVKPSVAFHMIRHAESNNNKVYSDAKNLFRFGASDYDEEGFQRYVDTHRKADPHLSPLGLSQAECLAENYLVTALLEHQASLPLRVLCSPMLRTILTIRPTIERLIMSSLREECSNGTSSSSSSYNNGYNHKRRPLRHKIHLIIVSFYHEIEGCHTKGRPEPGMSPNEIREYMFQNITIDADDDDDDDKEKIKIDQCDIDDIVTFEFVGFGDLPTDGWYAHGTGHESRIDAEARSAKYCLWLSEYLDNLMFSPSTNKNDDDDLFDVACLLPGEEKEDQHDKFLPILRRRRTVLAIGHGDFMSVVLKRLVGGYVGNGGRVVERLGLPHRTAFAHYNTGVTELEYFGHSRFIVMTTNVTPHIPPEKYRELRSGGTLRDGWAFTV